MSTALIPRQTTGPLPVYLAEDGNLYAADSANGVSHKIGGSGLGSQGPPGPQGPPGVGSGDMLKSVYDTDGDGIIDHAALADHATIADSATSASLAIAANSVPWTGITGTPSTFPPDSTAMLISVYDTNSDGICDHAALADTATTATNSNHAATADNATSAASASAVPWTGVTGTPATFPSDWNSTANKPATFPPDSTAMLKSVYDTNSDNIVDHASAADTAPWTGISGKPSTFPPDSTAMLKSVYDTNNDGISDHAALADTAPWTGISGKPATYPPDSTAMLISVYDSDNNGIVEQADTASSVAWTGVTGKRVADFYGTDTTNTGAYVASVNTDFTLTPGATVFVLPSNSCTANPTLNINSTGVKPIVNRAGSQLASGEIEANRLIGATYDGTNWRLFSRITKLYYAANPATNQFTIECAGYDVIKISIDFNSGTPGLNVVLQHVSDGTPIFISLRNTLGASVNYQVGVTGITNTVIPVYAIPSTSMGGGVATQMDNAAQVLNKTSYIFFTGILNANMGAVFLNL